MSKRILKTIALGLAAGLSVSTAQAALDTSYNPGDLIMGFQADADTDDVFEVNLGDAFQYRNALNTSFVIGNVNTQLNSLYGDGTWFNNGNLYVGAVAANNSNNDGGGTAVNGDFDSTIYYSRIRTSAGTVGLASSTSQSLSLSNVSNAAGNILQVTDTFGVADSGGTNTFTNTSNELDQEITWDQYNPISNDISQTAFSVFSGGVQDRLNTGTFPGGTFAGISGVVAVLDLYRISRYAPDFSAGGVNTFEGSLVLSNNGDISFVAPIPEPSSLGLLSLAGLSLFIARRRRRTA